MIPEEETKQESGTTSADEKPADDVKMIPEADHWQDSEDSEEEERRVIRSAK